MKTNEKMSQEEVVKVLDDTKGFLENTFRLYLITNGVDRSEERRVGKV